MPLYTYLCKQCSAKSDFLIGVSQHKEDLKCPSCGSKKLEKQISAFRVGGSREPSSGSSHSCSNCSGGNCSSCS